MPAVSTAKGDLVEMPPSWAATVPFYFEFPKDLIRESGGRRKLVGQAKMERLRLFEMAIQCSQLSVDKVDPCRLLTPSAPQSLDEVLSLAT